ncbi:MAG: DUF177 domain-containing protein [Lachnospiraceae bacterium]|nr:DUF177 domain-containing protein [Lachnospiraceae bacterium]
MLINLTEVFNTSGKVLETKIKPESKVYSDGSSDYEIVGAEEIPLRFSFIEKGKALVSGRVRMALKASCDRCLKEVILPLDFDIDRECASPDFKAPDPDEDEEIHSIMEGYSIDTERLLHDDITINWPVKILCREDCKGLCPVCGKDLNEGDCGCDTFVPDPRMAAIFDKIMDSTKEV